MTFAEKLKDLRKLRQLSQRALAAKVGCEHTYLSKIENGKLNFGDFPSEEMICKLAAALEVEEDELLLLAGKIPPKIRQRVLEKPDEFRLLAMLDDEVLDEVVVDVKQRTSTAR